MKPVAAILTALDLETSAVVDRFDARADGSPYEVGHHAGWDVHVRCVGVGNSGAGSRYQQVVADLDPDVALFVGIAGGVREVRKGDVVAAPWVDHYEYGKETDDGFIPVPSQHHSSADLVDHARKVARDKGWRRYILGFAGRKPQALVAPIASGTKVLAADGSTTVDRVRKTLPKAVAVDMESFGFLESGHASGSRCRMLVIRGISDLLADKNATGDATWQPRAARHAAAFAFAFLETLLPPAAGRPTTDPHEQPPATFGRVSVKRNRVVVLGNGNTIDTADHEKRRKR